MSGGGDDDDGGGGGRLIEPLAFMIEAARVADAAASGSCRLVSYSYRSLTDRRRFSTRRSARRKDGRSR